MSDVILNQDIWSIATAIPLLICSLIALALILDRSVAALRCKVLSQKQQQQVQALLNNGEVNQVSNAIASSGEGYQAAMSEFASTTSMDKELREEALGLWLARYTKTLRRRLSALTTIATLAPMLGLLGTIVGLMRSFHNIGLSNGPVEPALVADGLWQALSTTAAGMIIAVLCVMCHAMFQSRIRYHLSDVTDLLNRCCLTHLVAEAKND
ncbi:MotA/TolQ/ExbB proton channel family protein [Vibrio porteresiae]|uniref:MotA/TolQ/ExbB proton channel family protein n=1 Tax=Vibrio porteresiae DSM 19223 TaxID=1123496 RepID=A0ABZ0QG31_9VIBR|nr:MotA/TolQ/ExbB proton channel family protein [Vibrio porteresiae]WPC75152.1 MotA/TolQ/ExbB proton channel family protein [Vibrio porteresiae DSM 19223]